jgi:capsular polysaccharide biosynthesis protein
MMVVIAFAVSLIAALLLAAILEYFDRMQTQRPRCSRTFIYR